MGHNVDQDTEGSNFVGIRIVDIQDPTHPSLQSEVPMVGQATAFDVEGTVAYIAGPHSRWSAVDIHDPTHPTLLSAQRTPYPCQGTRPQIEVESKRVYLSCLNGINIFDVRDPVHPVLIGKAVLPADSEFVVEGTLLYSTKFHSLLISDVTDPAHPTTLSTFPLEELPGMNDQVTSLDVVNNRAYLAAYLDGEPVNNSYYRLQIVDVSDSRNPQRLSIYTSTSNSLNEAVRVVDTRAYYGKDILDVSDPGNPTLLGRLGKVALRPGGDVVDHVIYTYDRTRDDSGLWIIDAHNPTTPVLQAYLPLFSGEQIRVYGDLIYVANWSGGLRILRRVP
jgi:hypothetical protein